MPPQDTRRPTGAPPTQQETGKFRASRIPLDYYKHPDRLDRWRRLLLALAVAVALGWISWTLVRGAAGRQSFSRGPVAAVHATWEEQCQACHVSATSPIGSETRWLPAWFGDKTQTPDHQCQTCHSGSPHHANQKDADTPACAGCHRDHRGRDASLVYVSDLACTNCHRKLADHMDTAKPSDYKVDAYSPVTRFDTDHPEFRMVKDKDKHPSKLKFTHKRHMTPGLDCKFTLAKFSILDPTKAADNVKRYRRNADDALNTPVRLECSSCHQLESGDFRNVDPAQLTALGIPGAAVLPPRSPGTTMLPITYENQCAGCHPLSFPMNPEKPKGEYVTVRHRLQPPEVRAVLKDVFTGQLLAGNTQLLDKGPAPLLDRSVPRRRPGSLPKQDMEPVRNVIQEKVKDKESWLRTTACLKCHYEEGKEETSRIVPTNVPTIWFSHAMFSHASHKAVNCQQCHPQAYPELSQEGDQKIIKIPGKEVCTACHSPPSQTAAGLRGGTRFDCVECHRYHNGKEPLQGPGGAARRGPREPLDLQRFLSGSD